MGFALRFRNEFDFGASLAQLLCGGLDIDTWNEKYLSTVESVAMTEEPMTDIR